MRHQKSHFKRWGAALARDYRRMEPAEDARLAEIGKAATRAGQLKTSRYTASFGPRPRVMQQEEARQRTKAMHNAVEDVTRMTDSVVALNDIRQSTGSVASARSVALAMQSSITRRELMEINKDGEDLKSYKDGPGKAALVAASMAVPELVQGANLMTIPFRNWHYAVPARWVRAGYESGGVISCLLELALRRRRPAHF